MVQVVKLGGSVLTDKSGEQAVRSEVLDRLADELASAGGELVVVHGAGSFGHPLAMEHGLVSGIQDDASLQAASQVHADVRRLSLMVLDALRSAGLAPAGLSPMGLLSCSDAKPGAWNLVPIHRMLGLGLTPVTHGDLVLDTSRGLTVLSGDTIAREIARFLQAERVVFVADVDGIHTAPPDKGGELLEAPSRGELEAALDTASTGDGPDVTGGMAGKLETILALQQAGTEVAVVNGLEPDRLRGALTGKHTGTLIRSGGEPR